MSFTRKHLIWAAGLVFGLTLIANIPAALLYSAFKPKASKLEIFGLQGAWSSGQLSGITVNGRLLAQDLRWQFKPLLLLLARAAVHVEGGGELATLEGDAAASFGAARLSNFHFSGNLKRLASIAGFAYLPVDGQVGGEIATLIFKNGFIDTATATLDLSGLAWTLAREPMLVGNFHVEISTQPDAIIAKISSPSGPLEADGEAKLMPDKHYEVDIRLKLKPGASEILQNYVHSTGAPDSEGYYHLSQRGQLQ